jgi:hypothetical protein
MTADSNGRDIVFYHQYHPHKFEISPWFPPSQTIFNDRPQQKVEEVTHSHGAEIALAHSPEHRQHREELYNVYIDREFRRSQRCPFTNDRLYTYNSFKAQESILVNLDIKPSISWIVSRRLVVLTCNTWHPQYTSSLILEDDFPLGTRDPCHFCPDICSTTRQHVRGRI